MTTRTRARLIATLLGLILLATGIVAVVLHRGSMNGADADGTDGYDPTSYDIQIRYDPANDQIHGHTTITARATDDLTRFGLDLKLPASRVTVDGQPAAIAQKAGKLSITPSATVPEGHAMTVTVDYAGTPSALAPDPGMRAAWIRTGGGVLAGGEPDGAPWWYPSNDDPSNKATFTITVTVPAGLQAISNGALLGGPHTAAPGWVRWRWQETDPMAPYLAFLAIGHYDIVTTDTPVGPSLTAYSRGLPASELASARAAIGQTPTIINYFSAMFGPYPFHQLGAVIPHAMPHAFGISDSLDTQTRPIYATRARAITINNVVRALAHQWFGDSVSVDSWNDMWLSESLCTYAGWLYTEHTGGPSTAQIANTAYAQHPAGDTFWTAPIDDPGPAAMFSRPIAQRGAMALQALRATVGDNAFFATLRTWTTQHRYGNGSTQDFLGTIEYLAATTPTATIEHVAHTWLSAPTRPTTSPSPTPATPPP